MSILFISCSFICCLVVILCFYCLWSVFSSNRWLLTGAWDATVKLWELKNTTTAISSKPIAQFYDHENSVQAVALDGYGEYAAAGADDGTVLIWKIDSQTLIGNCQVSAPR